MVFLLEGLNHCEPQTLRDLFEGVQMLQSGEMPHAVFIMGMDRALLEDVFRRWDDQNPLSASSGSLMDQSLQMHLVVPHSSGAVPCEFGPFLAEQVRLRDALDKSLAASQDNERELLDWLRRDQGGVFLDPHEMIRFRRAAWFYEKMTQPNSSHDPAARAVGVDPAPARRWALFTLKWPAVLREMQIPPASASPACSVSHPLAYALQTLECIFQEDQVNDRKRLFENYFHRNADAISWLNDESLRQFFLAESRRTSGKLSDSATLGIY